MKLLYGTTNPAKMKYMMKTLEGLGIEMMGLNEVGLSNVGVDEEGNDPLENAKIKALFYYQQMKIPVFSCDSGLYLEGIEASRQPGVHVRRVGGKPLTDEEMIEYYTSLAEEQGGEIIAIYRNAIALVLDENNIYYYDGEDIASEKFIITSKPHERRVIGFPLNSISVEMESREYYFDLNRGKKNSSYDKGLREFFRRTVLKKP